MHVIAAKAACLGEALRPEFREYAAQVVKNAQAMADKMASLGFRIVAGGTDNHCFLVDLSSKGLNGADAQVALDKVGITVNKNAIPYDKGSTNKPSGIRIGTAAVTTRGLVEEDMDVIAECISMIIKDFEGNKDAVNEKVAALCAKYPLYE